MVMAAREILLVEDNADYRRLLARFLADRGYHVTEAGDGQEALEKLDRSTPGLVVTDWEMPRLDGIQLVEELRRRWPNLPILMISAAPHTPPGDVKVILKSASSLVEMGESVDRAFPA